MPFVRIAHRIRGKGKKKPQNQPENQNLKVALGSQAFCSPEEEAATLSQVQIESRAGISLCQYSLSAYTVR